MLASHIKKVLWICCMLFLLQGVCNAGDESNVPKKNEYGGKTVVFNFSNNGKNPSTVIKILIYLDSDEKKVKREVYYTDKFADKEGFSKMVDYFGINGEQIKKELFKNNSLIKSSGP